MTPRKTNLDRLLATLEDLPGLVETVIFRLRMTHQELADSVGVHRVTVTRWCTGKARPDLAQVIKLLRLLPDRRVRMTRKIRITR